MAETTKLPATKADEKTIKKRMGYNSYNTQRCGNCINLQQDNRCLIGGFKPSHLGICNSYLHNGKTESNE